MRYTGDEATARRADAARTGSRSRGALKDSGLVDFLNVIRGHIDTDAGLTDVIPIQGMRSAPHLDFAGEIRAATELPDLPRGAHPGRRHRAPRDRLAASSTWSA